MAPESSIAQVTRNFAVQIPLRSWARLMSCRVAVKHNVNFYPLHPAFCKSLTPGLSIL
jgi:hypothetical protein